MAVVLKHKKTVNKPDGTDESVIRPSDWNEEHSVQLNGPALMGKPDLGNGDAVQISIGDGLIFDGQTLKIDPEKQYVDKEQADQDYAAANDLAALGQAHNSFVASTNQALQQKDTALAEFETSIPGKVRDAVLTGLSFLSSVAVVATDNVLVAIGKIQAQLNNKADVKRDANGKITALLNSDGSLASIGGQQSLPHLAGVPASNLGASTTYVTVQKAYTFSNASITGGVLNLAAGGTAGKFKLGASGTLYNQLPQLSAGGFPLDPASDGLGSMIFDSNGTIPFGTYISSYGSGGNKNAAIGYYNLTNFFGAAIPNVAAGATLYAAACINGTTNFKLTQDCNKHSAVFGNFVIEQGSATDGSDADWAVTNDLRLYAYFEFVANDGVNTRVTIPATFSGQPYLVMPAGVITKVRCDDVDYPGYKDEVVAAKYFVLNNDLKGSDFIIPGYNATTTNAMTGLQEGILYGAANFCKKLTSDLNYWGGAYKSSTNQYRPFSFCAKVVKNPAAPEVFIAGDSITSAELNWLVSILKDANIPFYNSAKGGEAQFNWPMNVKGRSSGLAGNIFMIALATNGGSKGVAGATDILSLVKQARAAGYKRVIAITSSVQTTASVQIAASAITGSILTVASFTTGADLPVGAILTGGTAPAGTKVSAKIDATHYSVVNYDGSQYTGGDQTGITVYPYGSDNTQNENTSHVLMNQAILAWPKGGDYPDEILDIWAATRSLTNFGKWLAFIASDGIHPFLPATSDPNGISGTAKIISYAVENNFIEKIRGY